MFTPEQAPCEPCVEKDHNVSILGSIGSRIESPNHAFEHSMHYTRTASRLVEGSADTSRRTLNMNVLSLLSPSPALRLGEGSGDVLIVAQRPVAEPQIHGQPCTFLAPTIVPPHIHDMLASTYGSRIKLHIPCANQRKPVSLV